ncbi:DUF4153 domain-containing protein [Nocardia camponoti]|uniref:DUF4173 domain-containing protein n=1 Tax=Nocardia camponoti TaxID=1616106 RepID=A0A917V4W0_9NOCA|nr:DUF4173 domain-containing protein [Nocardia camponoti]GGK38058.1 hypothetical protein GCM10011591_07100 [Nocardia camponoti]
MPEQTPESRDESPTVDENVVPAAAGDDSSSAGSATNSGEAQSDSPTAASVGAPSAAADSPAGAQADSTGEARTEAAPQGAAPSQVATLVKAMEARSTPSPVSPWVPSWRLPEGGDADAATSAGVGPMPPIPRGPRPIPTLPVAQPAWRRVARPAGVLPAALAVGAIGATVVPLDRPGIGWLIAGGAALTGLTIVDRRARKSQLASSATTSDVREDNELSATADASAVAEAVSDNPNPAATDSASDSQADPAPSPVAHSDDAVATAKRAWWAGSRVWWTLAALVLLGVGTVRAAGWLFALCVLAAGVAGSLAVLGRPTARGIAHDLFAVPLATFSAAPWAVAGVRDRQVSESSAARKYGVSLAATVLVLLIFVPLLGGADATFAKMLTNLVPKVDSALVWQWVILFAVLVTTTLGALFLLAGPPAAARAGVKPSRVWARSEWVLPVGALTVLFAVFLAAQAVALFGGDDYVQETAGLTYAEYARSGFWQLSAVSVLTLAVILSVLRWASRESVADRLWLRVLLCVASALSLVIVCSALGRMWTYQQAYGFTVLRLLVATCELWIGLLYLLTIAAVLRLRWSWLPRAAVGTAMVTLIGLAILNPEYVIAQRNIDRWADQGPTVVPTESYDARTGRSHQALDIDYLRRLSTDILPALDRLPEEKRREIADAVRADLNDDTWRSWNWSRSR